MTKIGAKPARSLPRSRLILAPQHITQRFTLAEIEAATDPLRQRIAVLEEALSAKRWAAEKPRLF